MKKLINIAAVLLAASMIFVGCSNGVAAPGSNNGGSGSGNEAGGSSGSSSGSTSDGAFTAFTVDFTKCKFSDKYCQLTPASITKITQDNSTKDDPSDDYDILTLADGKLTIKGDSWDAYFITLPEAKDLTKAKKMTISAKKDGEVDVSNNGVFVVELSDGTKALGMDGWTDTKLFAELGDEAKDYTIDLSKLKDEGTANSVFKGALDKLNEINTICINPRGAKGYIVIVSVGRK